MENFYVQLGLDVSATNTEIDERVRLLLRGPILTSEAATRIRRILSEGWLRKKMQSDLQNNDLFEAEYSQTDYKIRFFGKLPPEYGKISVLSSKEKFETGPYPIDDFLEKHFTEVGREGKDGSGGDFSVVEPKHSEKFYYPAIEISVGGLRLYYIIGREENRAFVRNIRTSYTYKTVSVHFEWGKFSKEFCIVAPKDGKALPLRGETILRTVVADGESGEAVGDFSGHTEIAFVEKTSRGVAENGGEETRTAKYFSCEEDLA